MLIVQNEKDLAQALEFINTNEVLAYDTETTGLDFNKDKVIGFGVSNYTTGFYVPLYTYDSSSGELRLCGIGPTLLSTLLEAIKAKKLIMFNASFDSRFTKFSLGVDLLPSLACDVLLLKHTCDEEFPFGLKEIATKLWGVDVKAEKEAMQASIKNNGGTATEYYKADTTLLAKYCVQDCLLTYRMYAHYSKELKKQRLEAFFYEEEVMPLYKEVTIPMEEQGVRLNIPLMEQTLKEINQELLNVEAKIQTAIAPNLDIFRSWFLNKDYPVKERGRLAKKLKQGLGTEQAQMALWNEDSEGANMFNLNSKHHLKKLFFDTLKEEPLSRTPTGQPQVNEDFLELMGNKWAWAADLIIYNKLNKLKSTYIERFLNEQHNGVFYPAFMQHRTVSGRYSGDLQQLPRPIESSGEVDVVSKYTSRIREFIVPNPNNILMSADYEQLEPTIFAHTSNDSALQNIFITGTDFYSEVAIKTERLTNVSSDKLSDNYLGKRDKQARQRAKSYALGIAYGMTGYKLKFEIGTDDETADRLVQDYLNAFPGLARWMNESKDKVKFQGQIKTQSGRIRHMPRARELFAKYGSRITDSLQLWKEYHSMPAVYERVKADYREFKNLMNNSINFQVQGLAASIVNRAAISINRKLKSEELKSRLIMQVHDELVYEVIDEERQKVSDLVKSTMENIVKLSVPLRTTPQFGTNYRECK